MWQVVLDFLTVVGVVMLGVAALIGFVVVILLAKACVECAEEVEALKQENCDHENSRYIDWSPNGKWKCNDCGKYY